MRYRDLYISVLLPWEISGTKQEQNKTLGQLHNRSSAHLLVSFNLGLIRMSSHEAPQSTIVYLVSPKAERGGTKTHNSPTHKL